MSRNTEYEPLTITSIAMEATNTVFHLHGKSSAGGNSPKCARHNTREPIILDTHMTI